MARPRRRRNASPEKDYALERLLASRPRTEVRRGVEWVVQPVSVAQAQKEYSCPGCVREIPPGTAHVVAWRGDGVLGDSADLAARRHWHAHCWRMA